MKIVKIETTSKDAKVYLDNGEILEGVISVATTSQVDDISRVTLTAYVYNEPKKMFRYHNTVTGHEVLLAIKEADRFFDNRDPRDWKKL